MILHWFAFRNDPSPPHSKLVSRLGRWEELLTKKEKYKLNRLERESNRATALFRIWHSYQRDQRMIIPWYLFLVGFCQSVRLSRSLTDGFWKPLVLVRLRINYQLRTSISFCLCLDPGLRVASCSIFRVGMSFATKQQAYLFGCFSSFLSVVLLPGSLLRWLLISIKF